MTRHAIQISYELDDYILEIDWFPGTPARSYGRPEDCCPGDDADFVVTGISRADDDTEITDREIRSSVEEEASRYHAEEIHAAGEAELERLDEEAGEARAEARYEAMADRYAEAW